MSEKALYVGKTPIKEQDSAVEGGYVEIEKEKFYRIKNYDKMRPFFMTIVSAYDHWMFIYSNGGVTAGRKNPDSALFPYDTDDKIRDTADISGAKTILKVSDGNKALLWEPFSDRFAGAYSTQRNIYKNLEGCKVIFEEKNLDLGLTFIYMWTYSQRFGFIKKSQLINDSDSQQQVEVLDGIQNILPYGVDSSLQQVRSTLADAYKRNELVTDTSIGVFSLSSMIVDKAEPSEALMATIAWSVGLESKLTLLSSKQLADYRCGKTIASESDVKAEKGAYFINGDIALKPNTKKVWYIISELNQSHTDIDSLAKMSVDTDRMTSEIESDIKSGKEALRKKVGLADGIQLSSDKLSTGRHFSNVLFNIMRGGTFDDQYSIEVADLVTSVKQFNKQVYQQNKKFFVGLPEFISCTDLSYRAIAHGDQDLERLCMEYLPLSFSRRHGDPSRPWNQFNIETTDKKGKKLRNYEGNWRDIFQNWEALAYSYPEYIEGMIAKFVNASTMDGYNPYRITKQGIDWEVIEPEDPWSYIGYWGDHQIIYLLKLMEISAAYHPSKLKTLLTKPIFGYANVPYKIRGYDAIVINPSDTIDYDHHLAQEVAERVAKVGADGKMVWNRDGEMIRANLTEKLLVTSLTKLYNFIPEAGIWLNTQRPEWNDANNALVGNGVSMVTLYYLRRFLKFSIDLFAEMGDQEIELNKPVADLMDALSRGLNVRKHLLEGPISNEERRKLMDRFGIAGEHFRTSAYSGFLGNTSAVKASDIVEFFTLANQFLEHSIRANKREDGLYHAYNILTLNEQGAAIGPLYEMLEGQVAVLSSKYLNADEALGVLNALKWSEMFRRDQYSYMLYPDRDLPEFLQKNIPDSAFLKAVPLIQHLIQVGNSDVVEVDQSGHLHFNGAFHNANDVKRALNTLAENGLAKEVEAGSQAILAAFESTFNHKSFTGRSGTFYGYEGLGCIYWHMVSKLLLATQENIFLALDQGASAGTRGMLIEHYYEIRAGIGVNKSPELYGAFPTDAYSHTRKTIGAQQPGMTGQVKEDIINRWAELGVVVQNGAISFKPSILRESELLTSDAALEYYDTQGTKQRLEVKEQNMAFTYCQVPIIYSLGDKPRIRISMSDGTEELIEGNALSKDLSRLIFLRTGQVQQLHCQHVLSI